MRIANSCLQLISNAMRFIGSSFSRREALNTAGIVVLLLGLGSAGIVYFTGQRQPLDQANANVTGEYQDGTLSVGDSKKLSRTIEMNWGKLGVLTEKWSHWRDALSQPKPLSFTIATLSALVAYACFYAANQCVITRSSCTREK